METYEIFEKALALIEDEKNWTMGDWGDRGGWSRPMCAAGAIARVANVPILELWTTEAILCLDALVAQLGFDYPPASAAVEMTPTERFNDSHSHAEVIALFQKAIALEKQKAATLIEIPEETARV